MIRNRSSRCYAAIAVALTVSTGAAQAATRVPTHVACVGDSITAGVGASSGQANYPSLLQGLLGTKAQVMNYGVSGATMMSTADMPYVRQGNYTSATKYVSDAGATATVDVIIMLGTNDSKNYNWVSGTGTRADQFRKDCAALIDHFAQLPTHPLVYLALPAAAFDNTFNISGTIIHDQIIPILKDVAASKGIPTIDINTPTAGHREMFPDGVHPNDTGYKLLAQTMYDGLSAPTGAGGAGGSAGSGGTAGTGGAGGTAGAGGAGGTGGVRDGGTDGASGGSNVSDARIDAAGGAAGDNAGGAGASGSGGAGGAGKTGGSTQPAGGSVATGGGGGASGSAGASAGGAAGGASPASTSAGCSCVMGGASREQLAWPALSFGLAVCLRNRRCRHTPRR